MEDQISGPTSRSLEVVDLGRMSYGDVLERQKAVVEQRIAGLSSDQLIIVEHPPVVTIGRSGTIQDLRLSVPSLEQKGIDLYNVDRGGRATFHGPGQLVVYPIVRLDTKRDLHVYVYTLLQTLASVLEGYGLVPQLKDGNPGIWVNDGKIASIGIAVRKWVTYHGLSLNVNVNPRYFDYIIPCGQPDEKITSMEMELGIPVDLSEVKTRFIEAFIRSFGYDTNANLPKRPPWLTGLSIDMSAVEGLKRRLRQWELATVCESALCPNLSECFANGTATFMILGSKCTRHCRFCAVEKGRPSPVDLEEPERIAHAAKALGLKYVVVTSVTRDDLEDGGAKQFARVIESVRRQLPKARVEVLIPDFRGNLRALRMVCEARPDVLNHNIETVARLYPKVRPGADYRRSLSILEYAAREGLKVKSGIMMGLGETHLEIFEAFEDLRRTGCELLTVGQYLCPSKDHVPVARYISPLEFEEIAAVGKAMGFKSVIAGPLVRSSYKAEEVFKKDEVTSNGLYTDTHLKQAFCW